MVMTGAERQRQYRAKAKGAEVITLNFMVATDTRAQLKALASQLGLTNRETLEPIIGGAFTALLSDEQRAPEEALQRDEAMPLETALTQ